MPSKKIRAGKGSGTPLLRRAKKKGTGSGRNIQQVSFLNTDLECHP
jgi:hypothetical protein